MDKNDTVPTRGERVAAYVEAYLRAHEGLSLGELAFRLRADKRDMRRLLNERSCGWRLEDALAAYFGPDFVDAVFAPVCGSGPSLRERELERERAEIAARRERLERDRAARQMARTEGSAVLRMVSDKGREAHV
jgi:hypothetical protein